MCEQASQIKNGLQESFFSAAQAHAHAYTHTQTHIHTLSSLHSSSFAASASSPLIPLLIESQQLMAAFTPQLPVIAAPHLCSCLPGRQFFAGVGVVAACLCWSVDCASPSVVLSQGIDEQMACHISPCKVQVLQSAASCRTCFTAD